MAQSTAMGLMFMCIKWAKILYHHIYPCQSNEGQQQNNCKKIRFTFSWNKGYSNIIQAVLQVQTIAKIEKPTFLHRDNASQKHVVWMIEPN